MGRFDAPKLYRMLYAAESPEAAVGEAMSRFDAWEPHLSRRCLVSISVPGTSFVDLDDPSELDRHGIRPSRVVWPEREVTQEMARRLFEARRWIGLRWWSRLYSPWGLLGLWSLTRARVVGELEPLGDDHPAVLTAARILKVDR